MSITVEEKFAGRKSSGKGAERTYIIRGTADDKAARDALMTSSACPVTLTISNYITSSSGGTVTSTPTDAIVYRDDPSCEVEEVADGLWIGTASWQGITYPANSFSFSFDISGQQVKVTQSRQTINSYAKSGEKKRNFKGAIGVNQDGTVEGTDVLIPFLTYQETRTYGAGSVTTAFVNTMSTLVGSVNVSAYAGYDAGEILLTRCSGQSRSDGYWDITFGWSVSRNASSLTVGDITGIVKQGWDYLWVYYNESHDPDTNCCHKIPISCYVERVYPRNDFSGLAIG